MHIYRECATRRRTHESNHHQDHNGCILHAENKSKTNCQTTFVHTRKENLYPRTDDRNVCNRWTGRQLYFAGNYSNAILYLKQFMKLNRFCGFFCIFFYVFIFFFDCILRFDVVKLLFNLKLDDLDDSSTMIIGVYIQL